MATGEDDKKKEQGKGFAGLSSLLSDVDTTSPGAAAKPTANPSGNSGASRSTPQASPPRPQPAPQQPSKPPQQPGSGSSSSKWVWGINAVIIIGVLWLVGQSSNKPLASNPPTVPTNTAPSTNTQLWWTNKSNYVRVKSPTSSQPTTIADSDVMSSEEGATYRVPSFRLAELDADKRAAKSAQQKARDLDAEVNRQKILIDDEKRQVEQAERQQDALGNEIEQQRSLVDSSNQYELDAFNSKVSGYNTNRSRVRYRINKFNIDVNAYNKLVQRAQVQEQQANHMVDVYNSKLEQYGTRQ